MGWSNSDCSGGIYLDKLSYVGDPSLLTLSAEGLEINYSLADWETPFVDLNVSFEIINNNFFSLLELLTAEEREFKVRIESKNQLLFDGFLNNDANEIQYLNNAPIRLTASNYISKLENLTPTILNYPSDRRTLIDFISDSLKLTAKDSSIRVINSLYPVGGEPSTNQTFLNKCTIETELFWKNNIEKDSAYEILEKLLKSFNCYLYWYNNKWYVERYNDIWIDGSKGYIEYSIDSSSGINDYGISVNVNDLSTNIYSLSLANKNSTISIIPGLQKVEVNLNQSPYLNLTNNDFTNAIENPDPNLYYAKNRGWRYWTVEDDPLDMSWSDLGKSWQQISNSIKRTGWAFGVDQYDVETWKGLYTHFRCSVDSSTVNPTSLNISWKYAYNPNTFGGYQNLEDYTFKFYWWLECSSPDRWILYDETDGWTKEISTPELGVQVKEVKGIDIDETTHTYTVELTIPLSEITVSEEFTGDYDFNLCIGTETIDYGAGIIRPAWEAWIGDVKITHSGNVSNNREEGEINTKFYNKKTIDLDIFDIDNLNFKNGIYFNDLRTQLWTIDGVDNASLVDRLIENKVMLYNKSRQKITSDVFSSTILKPFSIWGDQNQRDKQFVLTGYTYNPVKKLYTNCTWNEYDNTTEITLNT